MADKDVPTIKELTARLKATLAQRARAEEAKADDPRRRDAIAGLIACLEAPRLEAKRGIAMIMMGALKASAGRASADRVRFLKRSFEAYADELREKGNERTAQLADRTSGHCAEWIEAMLDDESESQPGPEHSDDGETWEAAAPFGA